MKLVEVCKKIVSNTKETPNFTLDAEEMYKLIQKK